MQINGKRKTQNATQTGHASGTYGDPDMGNSEVIRREFRGNSDRKKGIQKNSTKKVSRLQGVLEAEATPSSPYIILKRV